MNNCIRVITAGFVSCAALTCETAQAGGGYFILGYGPLAGQSAGTSTAFGFDGFAGASNPAKLSMVDDRLDLDVIVFNPVRHISRSGAVDPNYDISTTSKNDLFFLPEAGYAHRIDERFSWGVSLYGNGGENTEYHGTTGVAGTTRAPGACGDRPGNFFGGCGQLGVDLSQLIVAPTVSWRFLPDYSFGFSPLIGYEQFKAYGLQTFEAVSVSPDHVTNQGYARSFGIGARAGFFGRVTRWLDVGAAYSTEIFFQDFEEYRGLIAHHGSFDIPANASVGFGLKLGGGVTLGGDVQRIFFKDIPQMGNGTLNSVRNPPNDGFGSRNGTGFHWDDVTTYRFALTWAASERVTLRAGGAYGHKPSTGGDANSTSLNLFAPNANWQATAGGTFALSRDSDVQFAYGRYLGGNLDGESATGAVGIGGQETIHAFVNTWLVGYSVRFGKGV